MRMYARYLFHQLVLPALIVTLAFSGAVWLSQSLQLVDMIVNRGLSIGTFLYLTALIFPSLLLIILPFALFIAVLFTYNKLAAESELAPLRSAGLSNWQLAVPALTLAVIVTLIAYAISLYLMPAAYRSFKNLQYELREELSGLLLQEGVFTSPLDNLTVFVRNVDDEGNLHGILVHDQRDNAKPVTMTAERGFLLSGDNGPSFVLEGGSRQELDSESRDVSILYFDRYTLDLVGALGGEEDRWREVEERSIDDLLFPSDDPRDQAQYGKLVAEGHKRLTWPLGAIVFTLIALAALLPNDLNRRGQWLPISLAVLAALAVQAGSLSISSLAASHLGLIPAIYAVMLVPGLIALMIIFFGLPRRRPRGLPEASPAE
ncbi:MAG: LPS export ABC transporter permease LptF [Geminicoccaceae bacterium]